MALFEAKNVTKQYGNQLALDNVSISVPEQCIYGLLGPNGAGKTTLIRIINQITGPDTGELFLNGKKLVPSDVQLIGYLPEERGLYKKMKVGEQALYFAQLKGLSQRRGPPGARARPDRLSGEELGPQPDSRHHAGLPRHPQLDGPHRRGVLHEPRRAQRQQSLPHRPDDRHQPLRRRPSGKRCAWAASASASSESSARRRQHGRPEPGRHPSGAGPPSSTASRAPPATSTRAPPQPPPAR